MNRSMPRRPLTSPVGALALAAAAASPAAAQTVLIDFGNDTSYRGASVVNPDANGNHWTSVWSGAFYENIVGMDGLPTDVDFGFSAAGGNDSYNGPAAGLDGFALDPADAVYDPVALGDLAADAAVFDYYVNSAFQVQGLDPARTYDITFYGSHKYPNDDTTRYTAYDADPAAGPANVIDSVDLFVGLDGFHNEEFTAQLTGLVPDVDGIIYIGFLGANGGNGYLNCLKVEAPTPGCAGDVNGDGSTDVFDFGDLASNFGAGPDATREQGDLNGDGFVDVFDFGDLAADFGCAP
jgi:hypothetical protein